MGLLGRIPPFSWVAAANRRRAARRLARTLRAYQNQLTHDEIAWLRSDECRHLRAAVDSRGLRGRHAGKRCFVIGNGPSLNRTDLRPLANEFTIGMNRIFLLFDRIDWRPSYYVAANRLVLEQSAKEIAALEMPRFLALRGRAHLAAADGLYFVRTLPHGIAGQGFSKNILRGWWEGATVTYNALQLAHFLGFETVVLIGVDHHFETKGPAHKEVVSKADDPNHFAGGYFGPGFRWNLPDLDWSEFSYAQAREAFEEDGRKVLDATVGGRLEVFPKVEYGSLF